MDTKGEIMTLENSIRLLAGSLVIISVSLGYLISPWWFLMTAFVGVNLIQSSFTKFCPAEIIFEKVLFGGKDRR
jgi:hypothetical protein